MNFSAILAELKSERARIDQAITAIESLNSSTGRRRGRPPASITAPKKPRRRRIGAAVRRKLSRLLKQRWAQGKMKPRAKATPSRASKPARRVSRAARKRMAAAQRARWAKVKAQQS